MHVIAIFHEAIFRSIRNPKEIASRIGMAKKVFQDKRKLFTGKMNLELKKRIVKCLVWSVATYAAETWTLREVDSLSDVDLETNGED